MKHLRSSVWKQPLLNVVHEHLVSYGTPSNLNNNWNWGSLAGLCLVLQIVTGVCLAMHYTANVDLAFSSIQHIMRDVPSGWLLRYVHANGAGFFFMIVYIHIFRGLYYSSYTQPREFVWLIGVVILLLLIVTAFIGYILPWGQMSLWGATVITSLASAIPVVGQSIVTWLWGGFSVDNPTLNRFYSLHYLLPFILAALSIVHLAALHQYGSTNPLGINAEADKIDFYPYYTSKDLVSLIAFAFFGAILIWFAPNYLSHPDNQVPANPYSTPESIVPEWYFLWVYSILRSIPSKGLGILAIALVFISLFSLPYIHKPTVRSPMFRPLHNLFFWTFIADCFILTWIGACHVEDPYVLIGQLATCWFFFYLLVLTPSIAWLEANLVLPESNKLTTI
uniref:Cytochrome b n=1 Tax=Jenufa perforata TaxID=993091 RepID=A0A6G7IU69_9CHLO|nr:apocytochrome b [Jenufa perforata]QII41616.1 apocytochrome b [Jenufa perforata]